MTSVKAQNTYKKNDDGSYTITSGIKGKIAGTFLGPIMGKSPWNTPFSTACKILRIWDEDQDDKPSIKAGKILEPVILNYLDKSGRLPNTQAEVLFPGYEKGWHGDWQSHFPDDVFSGHIDAIAGRVTDATKGIGIVENKTTSNPNAWDWVNNIPPETYWLQASLYAYFFGYDTIYFTVGILTPEDVDNPYKFVPSEDNVKIMKVGLYPDFENVLFEATKWYDEYIENGTTPIPDMNNPIDAQIVAVLDAQQSTSNEILPIFNEYLDLVAEIGEKEKKRDNLREQIVLYLESHGLEGIGNGITSYKVGEYSRKMVDTDRMKADGIYDAYLKNTVTKSFRKGKF